MNTTELLEIFSTFTREDWDEFDGIRFLVFQPTQEEIESELINQVEFDAQQLQGKMAILGLPVGTPITKELTLHILESMNAELYIGEDLEGWIDDQTELFGSLEEAFKSFVARYL